MQALEHDPKLEPARRNGERAAQFASRIPLHLPSRLERKVKTKMDRLIQQNHQAVIPLMGPRLQKK